MNKQPDITVIVPVYNVSKYIDACLNSICNQMLTNLEIIVINDGSTDKSLSIINRYAKKDERIKVIDQPNSGCAIAKNNALKMARGKYIAFIDGDDRILPQGLEAMQKVGKKNKLDIVMSCWRADKKGKWLPPDKEDTSLYEIKTGEQYLIEKLTNKDYLINITTKLYRRTFLTKNKIYFPEGLIHDDQYFDLVSLFYAKKVKFTNLHYYIITKNPDSITRRKDRTQNGHDILKICHLIYETFKKNNNSQLQILINDYLARLYLYGIDFGNLYNEKIDKSFIKKKAYYINTKLKVTLFIINKWLYKGLKIIFKG